MPRRSSTIPPVEKLPLERGLVDASDRQWVHGIVDRYLDDEHRRHPETGWPIPSLAPEIGRAEKAPRQAFERLVGSLIAKVAAHLPLGDPLRASQRDHGTLRRRNAADIAKRPFTGAASLDHRDAGTRRSQPPGRWRRPGRFEEAKVAIPCGGLAIPAQRVTIGGEDEPMSTGSRLRKKLECTSSDD